MPIQVYANDLCLGGLANVFLVCLLTKDCDHSRKGGEGKSSERNAIGEKTDFPKEEREVC